jgi:butyryl-CoA dehydrogenase
MNFDLTGQEQMLAKTARIFAEDYLDPITLALDQSGVFPRAIIGELARQGFLGLLLPKAAGGAGAGFVGYIEVVQALSRSCPAIASILNGHSLAAYAIARWGTDAQGRRHLPALAKGENLGALAIYEHGPSPGRGAGALVATRHGRKFVLNGAKAYVRNAGPADLYIAFATLQPADPSPGLTAFIVDAQAPGLTVGRKLETMGLQGCPVAHLQFDNVSAPQDALLGAESDGSAIMDDLLDLTAVAEGAQAVAIGKTAGAYASDFAKKRIQFGRPIASFEAIQTLLAEIGVDSYLAELAVLRTAQRIEDKAQFAVDAAVVRAFLARVGANMVVNAIQVEGGLGISETMPFGVSGALPLARMLRDMAGVTLLDAPADFPDKRIAESLLA